MIDNPLELFCGLLRSIVLEECQPPVIRRRKAH